MADTKPRRQWLADVEWLHGGNDPLDEVSALAAEGHWHYVGRGLHRHPAPALTFRLPSSGADEPPEWPVQLLQGLARDVVTSGQAYAAGHLVDLGGPIDGRSEICALAFVQDPELGAEFLQAVGLTADEVEVSRRWDVGSFLTAAAKLVPLLVTDPARGSLLADVSLADEVTRGIAKDGSGTLEREVRGLEVTSQPVGISIALPAVAASDVYDAIRGRLLHDRPLLLEDRRTVVTLTMAAQFDVVDEESDVTVEVPAAAVPTLLAFLAKGAPGSVEPVRGLTVELTAGAASRLPDELGREREHVPER